MLSIEERCKQVEKKLAHYERQEREKRVEARREREAQKKAQQRINYVVGEIILKHFPQLAQIEPLEEFLAVLVAAPEVREAVERLTEVTLEGGKTSTAP